MTILTGDCRLLMPGHAPFDMILADPPYSDTSLAWDRRVDGWLQLAHGAPAPAGSLWVFGSLRCFMATADLFADAGLRVAQEIVWEKQNGSSFHADCFRPVHELAVQFYPAEAQWRDIYNDVQTTPDATARTVRRKKRPPHTGHIDAGHYVSEDGGPRITRQIKLETSHSAIACSLVSEGLGVSVVNPFSVLDHRRNEIIVRPFLPAIKHSAYLLYPRAKPDNRLITKFVTSLKLTALQDAENMATFACDVS